MPQYKVKLPIRRGEEKEEGKIERHQYNPGDTIDVSEEEAFEMRHALEEPPKRPSKRPPSLVSAASRRQTASGDDLEQAEEEEPSQEEVDALDSIRKRPDNPDSGVQLHWQSDAGAAQPPSRTLPVGHGFERASAPARGREGLAGPGAPRPETNKTEMELEEEEAIKKAEEEGNPSTPAKPDTVPPRPVNPATPATPGGPGTLATPATPAQPSKPVPPGTQKK